MSCIIASDHTGTRCPTSKSGMHIRCATPASMASSSTASGATYLHARAPLWRVPNATGTDCTPRTFLFPFFKKAGGYYIEISLCADACASTGIFTAHCSGPSWDLPPNSVAAFPLLFAMLTLTGHRIVDVQTALNSGDPKVQKKTPPHPQLWWSLV